uniref:Phospholipid scramblase n=1 Tax=Saccoglossus kowalevskii TaxID=10224 RepID=A0ABM0M7B4_SACKO|nr:PREDICTED: phospholipid scramblase 2-like [Saccoglossus kowalevskii]
MKESEYELQQQPAYEVKTPQSAGYNVGPPQQGHVISKQPGMGQKPNDDEQIIVSPQDPLILVPDCPPGLEYLTQIDQLLVRQKMQVAEKSGFCVRQICGPMRPFKLNVKDHQDRTVLVLKRPYRCDDCCFFCCLMKLEVYTADGLCLGRVQQTCSICIPKFDIRNSEDETILKMKGPCIKCRCCSDVKFDVYTADMESKVGRVSKQWSGLGKELITDADNFGISFPIDLDVKLKAVMLGAVFLIDFMYFEKIKDNK